jgi:hypothetical protein
MEKAAQPYGACIPVHPCIRVVLSFFGTRLPEKGSCPTGRTQDRVVLLAAPNGRCY